MLLEARIVRVSRLFFGKGRADWRSSLEQIMQEPEQPYPRHFVIKPASHSYAIFCC
jgi:hypothetical protein